MQRYWEVNYIDVYAAATAAANTTQTSTSTISVPTIPYPTGSNSSITRTSPTAFPPTPVPSTSAGPSQSVPVSVSTTTPTVPSASPTDSIVPVHDPATIGTFAFLGCFSSSTSYTTFTEFQTSDQMVPELCVSLCSSRRYAGVYDTSCYCADALDAGTSALPDRDSCDLPCPGNAVEFCGGLAGTTTVKRQLLSDILLTLYGNMAAPVAVQPPPAPGQGASSPGDYYFEQVIVSTVTYTAVCSTNPAELVTSEYCTTVTVTNCPWSDREGRPTKGAVGHSAVPETKAGANNAAPVTKSTAQTTAVPMTTVTQSCNGCGAQGESVVTLTQPEAVVVALTKLASVSVPVETGESIPMPVQVSGASLLSGLSAVLAVGMALAGALLLG